MLNSTEIFNPLNPKANSSNGFTLAEILTTLTVISLIALITIPNLLQNTNQAELKMALKKDFLSISEAVTSLIDDNHGTLADAYSSSSAFNNAFAAKVRYIKKCTDIYTENCWHASGAYKFLNGTAVTSTNYPTSAGMVLTNGTLIYTGIVSSSCTQASGSYTNNCGYLNIDVNGFKAPNTFGKDIFQLQIYSNKLMPSGTQGDANYNSTSPVNSCDIGTYPSTTGLNCSADYLYQ